MFNCPHETICYLPGLHQVYLLCGVSGLNREGRVSMHPDYGGLATFCDRQRIVRRARRVVAIITRRFWCSGLASPRAVLAMSFAVRLCASALAFEYPVRTAFITGCCHLSMVRARLATSGMSA